MGNGIPTKLPAPEENFELADDTLERLEAAMLEQQKKELSKEVLEEAISLADERGFNRINTPLVARAQFLLSLVSHKFAEVRVEDYKTKWEWSEAEKDPEGELMYRLTEEKEAAELKASKRKKPVKFFNVPVHNRPDCTVQVTNLSKMTTESMLRAHLDAVIDPAHEDPKTKKVGPAPRKAGNFVRCHIPRDEKNGNQGVGIAFLEYPDSKQMTHALECSGSVIDYDKIEEQAAQYGVDQTPSKQSRNTISFEGREGWILPGEGIMFEELAAMLNTPTVNLSAARAAGEKSISLNKKFVYNAKGDVVGQVKEEPKLPDFIMYSGDAGRSWGKVTLPENMFEKGDYPVAVLSRGFGSASVRTNEGRCWATPNAGELWVEEEQPEAKPQSHVPIGKNGKPRKRKPRAILMVQAPPIPTPPVAPTINKCVVFKVDSCQRFVKAHFLPPFKDLLKKNLTPQQAKDKEMVFEYIKTVRELAGVSYFPSGVAMEKVNPWEGGLDKAGETTVCSICNGALDGSGDKDHEECIRSHKMAEAGMIGVMSS